MSVKLLKLVCLVLGAAIICDVVEKGMAMPVESRDKRSDDAGPLEAVVEKLAQQVTLLNAQVSSQNAQVSSLNTQVSSLNTQVSSLNAKVNGQSSEIAVLKDKADTLGKTVAFYARNNAQIRTTAVGTLIFDHADTNVGNAYSTLTGVFTAPVSGLYLFQTTFMCDHLGSRAFAAIYVDSKLVADGISDMEHGHYDQTTISSLVHVSAGQHVYVKNPDSKTSSDYHENPDDPYTTFSGFLLHAD